MVTFKAVVLEHQQREDGSYNVKIRVTHQRKSKYISTTFTAYKTDLTRSLKIKEHSSLMFKCNDEIRKMNECLSSLGYVRLAEMNVAQVVEYINKSKSPFKMDFFEFAEEYISKLSEGNRKVYKRALNMFVRFLGEEKCDINSITKAMVNELMDYIATEPKMVKKREGWVQSTIPKNAASSQRDCISHLKTIFNAAKMKYNDEDLEIISIPRNPFDNIKFAPVQRKGPECLSIEDMQTLISYNEPLPEGHRLYLDIFILSFAFRGMNIADMYELKKPSDSFTYYRKKTRKRRLDKAETRVLVPAFLDKYIERLSGGGYLIKKEFKKDDPYFFSSYCSMVVKNVIKRIIGKEYTMYAARDTFATLARNHCKVDTAIVDESLVHASKFKLIDAYVQKDWDVLHDVQLQVLALFDWE